MKYSELLDTRNTLRGIVSEFKMSRWEIQKAKEMAKSRKIPLIDAYNQVIQCRELWGSLAL